MAKARRGAKGGRAYGASTVNQAASTWGRNIGFDEVGKRGVCIDVVRAAGATWQVPMPKIKGAHVIWFGC